ncbi:MAG: penicillin-binding protein [Akkermansia sp.]|nr:penicillin-binding protein [Akkermansia sp.]MBR2313475.1 penicillin-binding protein [Akkermansia sp.]
MARYKAPQDDSPPPAPRERVDYCVQAPPRRRQTAARNYEEEYEEEAPPQRPAPRRAWEAEPVYEPLPENVNPIREFQAPPRKGTGCLRALWLMLTLPLRLAFWALRNLPRIILIPTKIILSLAFVGLILSGILAIVYGVKAGRYDLSQVTRMPERTIVLDRKGNEIGTLHGENRRSIANIHEEVPRYMIDALVMQEDRSFWTHGGIDPRGLLRAVAQVFKHHRTTQGASTLTMQLAKNTYNHSQRNFDAKFTEMALARRIESTYDKETIITCYLNRVFWGHTFLGLKQAAYGYFDKLPRDLTVGEAAMLAGIICSPNQFSPYRNMSAAKVQRDKVLKLMYEHGKITRNEYEYAMKEPLVTRKPERRGNDNYALDLVRAEVDHLLSLLDSKDERLKEEVVVSGGLRVQTTLDIDLQDDAMREIDARLTAMFEKQKGWKHQTRAQFKALKAQARPEEADKLRPKYLQAACAVIDNATGALLAVVGGRDSTESPLNRALQSRRQVGSVFKPLVYTAFFERGYGPRSIISDNAIMRGEIAGAATWRPRNSDGRFTGNHPAAWGLLKSRNTMAVRAGNAAGLQNVVNTALTAGFPRPHRTPGPTIYLGTWEASPLEVAGAFTAFANGGVRPTPFIIQSITDKAGRVVWQNTPSARRVCSMRAANAVSAVLQQITKPGGTAGSMQRLGFKHPCGGKTGTTNNYTNAWFCGFTSDLTAAVWVGFDRPAKIAEKAYGGTVALPLWVGVMQCAAARGYQMKPIRTSPARARNSGIRLCRVSGMLAHAGCEYEGKAYIETMADLSKQRSLCTVHAELAEDPDSAEADEVAEDPDATPSIDGASGDLLNNLPEDDIAEEV